jgi:uncharacterized membrane protein YraQ (UPF0718 family)
VASVDRFCPQLQRYACQVATELRATFSGVGIRLALGVLVWAALYVANEWFWDALFFDWLGLAASTQWVAAAHFFLYDLIKILLLVAGITFAVTYLQSYVSVEKTREWLSGRREGVSHLMAAFLGVVTPFCSCSSVPLFIGFLRGGVPLGVTMTFLISSPLISEVAVVLLAVYFGWQVAALYVVAGVTIAVFSGWLIERLNLTRYVEPIATRSLSINQVSAVSAKPSANLRLATSWAEATKLVRSIFPYLIAGLAVGALIHGWVPQNAVTSVAGVDNPLAVPMMVLLGIPLYGGAASVLPLIEVLHAAAVPIGTLLALLMSVIALSLPELILLKRVLKTRLLVIFVGIVAAGIVAIGYLFNIFA